MQYTRKQQQQQQQQQDGTTNENVQKPSFSRLNFLQKYKNIQ